MEGFPDFICVHCDTPLNPREDRTNVKFQWGSNRPHCIAHVCSDYKTCSKTLSKKGKRFLKNRDKYSKERSIKEGRDTRYPDNCGHCHQQCLNTEYVFRYRKRLCPKCKLQLS